MSKNRIVRKEEKLSAILNRIEAMQGNERVLLSMLDETKLDLIIVALGIGEVELS